MSENRGKVVSINGNLVSVEFSGNVSMNEICYVKVDNTSLKSEVIRIRGNIAQIQVYEMTGGIKCGDVVELREICFRRSLAPVCLARFMTVVKILFPSWPKKRAGFWSAATMPTG